MPETPHESALVKVLFFGRLGERLGREREFDLPDGDCTVAELRRRLAALDADLADALGDHDVRVCIDGAIVPETAVVRPIAEIAFIPPLSGG